MREKQAEKKKEGRREDIFKNPREHDRNYDRETSSTNKQQQDDWHSYVFNYSQEQAVELCWHISPI